MEILKIPRSEEMELKFPKAVKTELRILCERVVLLLFTSVVILYFVESIYFQSFSEALRFLFLNDEPKVVLLNWCIGLLFELTLSFFLRSLGACFGITSAVAIILVIVNELKMSARGEAFTLNDISVAKEALQVAGNYELKLSYIDWQVILLTVVLVVILVLFRHPETGKGIRGKKGLARIAAGLLCGAIGVGVCGNIKDIMAKIRDGGEYVYIASQYYDQNGFQVGLMRTVSNRLQTPENYSREKINEIYDDVEEKGNITETPNLIFVMNESLYDISILEGVKLSRDPLAGLRELQKKYTYGEFLSPTYGGGTCNVEFEVLTGCPLDEIGTNALPYSELLHKKFDSLVGFMNDKGYYSIAMHPNTGNYFNRRNVYRYMGFQEVFFTEEMGELPHEGFYAGDLALYERLITLFDEKKADTPFFAYVITMQNHGGYEYAYERDEIKVLDSGKCENHQALETYVNLIDSSVEAFRSLVSYFETVEEPTVIVMFGDHSPGAIGSFGYSEELLWGESRIPLFRATPLVVYSNYNLPYEDWGYINGYSLASKVMDYCGIKTDSFWTYGLKKENVPKLGGYYYIDGEWVAENAADLSYIDYRKKLWVLAYDRIFGKDYYGKR